MFALGSILLALVSHLLSLTCIMVCSTPLTDPRFWQWSLLSDNLSVRSTNRLVVRLHSSSREDSGADQLIFLNIQLWSSFGLKWSAVSLSSSLLKPKDSACSCSFHVVTTFSVDRVEGSAHQHKTLRDKQVHIEMVPFLHHCSSHSELCQFLRFLF